MLLGGKTAQGRVRAVVIVGPHPLCCGVLNIFNAESVVLGQPFVADCPVEPLDMRILLWLAWLDVFKPDAPLLGSVLDGAANVLRPVVTANHQRFSAPGNDLFQGALLHKSLSQLG